jgi:homoserine O-succinyltransferase/O-acetyltransferase
MSKIIKIAILDMYDNVPNEGMRCLKMIAGNFLAKEGVVGNYDIFNVRGNNEIPDLSYDIYISSGGPGSPLESDEPWEKPYFEFLNSIIEYNKNEEEKKYLFAICHSFQLLARFSNLGLISKRKSTSFGVMPIHRVNKGYNEPFFEKLPELFYAVDSRDYQLTAINEEQANAIGATVLALEKERPHIPLERAVMAIRYSDEIFSTQFHPEADAEGMLRYFLREDKKQAVINEHGEAKY